MVIDVDESIMADIYGGACVISEGMYMLLMNGLCLSKNSDVQQRHVREIALNFQVIVLACAPLAGLSDVWMSRDVLGGGHAVPHLLYIHAKISKYDDRFGSRS